VELAPRLYRLARRLTQRPDDASAVTLSAITALHATADQGPEWTRGVAFKVLWRALEDRWREQGHVPQAVPQETAQEIIAPRLTDDESELDRLLISRLDSSPEVDVALRQLSERERFAVLMIDVEDGTRDEAAEALGCDTAEVAALLLGARARVFASLVEYARRAGGRSQPGER
jgi:DNA-directed RNA polymerase specialized sigma24 family protein